MALGMKRGRGLSKAMLGLALAVSLTAAACAGNRDQQAGPPGAPRAPADQNVGPCPLMGVLYDAARIVEVEGEERFSNVGYTGEITGVSGLCRYRNEEPITMELKIQMAVGKGPKATASSHTYKYWVAVARRDVAPISKQYFAVDVNFGNSARAGLLQEVRKITITRATKDTSGVNFEILVGFELTPAQLAFNRDGKRFRVNAAQAAATP